jgi:hypothetical protein
MSQKKVPKVLDFNELMKRSLDLDEGTTIQDVIRNTITKYSMGQEVWFGCDYTASTVPDTQYVIPVLRVFMGSHGSLLGPENNVWFYCAWSIPATMAQLELAIQKGCENLREQRAKQLTNLNGMGGMPSGPTQPLPKRLPPGERPV